MYLIVLLPVGVFEDVRKSPKNVCLVNRVVDENSWNTYCRERHKVNKDRTISRTKLWSSKLERSFSFVVFGKFPWVIWLVPAEWLCDASSVLVGVWLLITLRFQPSPLASKLLAAQRKGEQSVSLSLPVHSLSTASPMQCLLAAAGVYGCRKAPEPNCKGETSMTQRWSRRRRTKVPTAVKADEVIPSYSLDSPTSTADQVEEENLQLPTVVKAEE